jgi:DNA mismatch repair protein MutL
LIKQRAHQRVLYEQFLKNITVQQAASQQLIFPITLHYASTEVTLLAELQHSLENTGFVFDSIAIDGVIISGIPVNTNEREITIILDQLISDLQQEIPESNFSQNDALAKSMAKSMAVKTGTYLSQKEQENLVNDLFACKEPNVSPFNKPTFITLTVDDLDKKFAPMMNNITPVVKQLLIINIIFFIGSYFRRPSNQLFCALLF